jgi:hypothetical protein
MSKLATTPPQLREPKSSVISEGRRKVRSLYVDGLEIIEEYDVITDELLLRKCRRPTPAGGEGEWVTEVGNDERVVRGFNPDLDLLKESMNAPQFSRKDTDTEITFRVRNLPYPKDVFNVSIDTSANVIVVRTSNKKYFKRIELPDMDRAGLRLDAANLTWDCQHNTLIITYAKHMAMRIVESQEKKERGSMKSARVEGNDQPKCAQQ